MSIGMSLPNGPSELKKMVATHKDKIEVAAVIRDKLLCSGIEIQSKFAKQ